MEEYVRICEPSLTPQLHTKFPNDGTDPDIVLLLRTRARLSQSTPTVLEQ